MSRKLEKGLMKVAGGWEILLGILTIFLYAPYYSKQGIAIDGFSLIEVEAISAVFGSLYLFIVSFGILFLIVGLINIWLSQKLKEHTVLHKIPVFLIVLGLCSYLVMDIVGGFVCLSAGVLALAKNKGIKRFNQDFSKGGVSRNEL